MTTQTEDRDVTQSHNLDPFPQPQTIPAGWDLSTLLSSAEADSAQQVDNSSDTESN